MLPTPRKRGNEATTHFDQQALTRQRPGKGKGGRCGETTEEQGIRSGDGPGRKATH